jgi:NAD(P)-dependent dehydrogenase (short-subunit alcohol dehydrogenase family)
MLQQCLRAELGPKGIAVGLAKPGAVDTDLLRAARDADVPVFPDAPEIRRLYEEGGVASPEEAAAFLAHLLLEVELAEFSAREWDRRGDGTVKGPGVRE